MSEKAGKAVAPRAPREVATRGNGIGIEGFEGTSSKSLGLRPPLLKINHEKARWTLGSVEEETVRVILLKAQDYREYVEMEGQRPVGLCASSDGKVPHQFVPNPKSESCKGCPYGTWTQDPNTQKWIKPPCDDGLAFFGVWPARKDCPFFVLFKRSAIKPAREFGQAVVNENLAAMTSGAQRIRGFYDLTVTLGLQKERKGTNNYFTPTFKFEKNPVEVGDKYRVLYLAAAEALWVPAVEGAELPEEAGLEGAPGEPVNVTPQDAPTSAVPF